MKNSRIIMILNVCLLSFSSGAYSINKCTDENGKISFQDQPCGDSSKSEKITTYNYRSSDNIDNFHPVFAKIPGVGDVIILSYNWWDDLVIQPENRLPPTIKMKAKAGETPLSLSMTFIPNKNHNNLSLQESADLIARMSEPYIKDSVEKQVILKKLESTIGTAILASFNQEKYKSDPIPEGEYSTITVGHIAHPKLVVGITLLTNGTDSKAYTEAINVISSFQVVVDKK